MGTRLIYATLVVIAMAGVAIGFYTEALSNRDLVAALLALFGTFLGALFAFRLNENKETRKLTAARKAALNQALFALIRQYNAMRTYAKYLAPFSDTVLRAINLPAHKPPTYSDLFIEFQELGFLLEGEYANVLMRLMVEQERFHQALGAIRIRNEFHVTELQPTLENLKLNGSSLTEAEIASALGERVYGTALSYGEAVFTNITENVQGLAAAHEELFKTAKALYPDEKFLKFSHNA